MLGKCETQDGKVYGVYFVWLEKGKLLGILTFNVHAFHCHHKKAMYESCYVPIITFEDKSKP